MGADIKTLRSRIKSVDSTLHLTNAMGLVASSKIKKATTRMIKSNEYREAFSEAVQALIASPECAKSPYMQKRDTDKLCLIVVAGDRGLAGGYNANIFRFMRDYSPQRIIPVGKRACDRYKGSLIMAEDFGYEQGIELAKDLCRGFREGEFDKVGILYTRYVSIMSQEPCIRWLLPLEREEGRKSLSVLFEPDQETVLANVVYEYIAAMIVAGVRESYASEVAARRFAMDAAGKNAQTMLDDLSVKYNRARQGAITQEITEIVAGSDA